jgi:hypothetical protein
LNTLVAYTADIAFITNVDAKVEPPPATEWAGPLLARFSDLLVFDNGMQLILRLVDRQRDDRIVLGYVQKLLLLFDHRMDSTYQRLFEHLVKQYRTYEDLMSHFYTFPWMETPHLMVYFEILLPYLSFDRLRGSVESLVNHPLHYTRDSGLSRGYAAVLRYVSEERDRMMDYLVANITYYIAGPESEIAVREIINRASFHQPEGLLGKFEGFLRAAEGGQLLPHIAVGLDQLLLVVSTNARLAFMKRNQDSLTMLAGARFMKSLKYMEYVLKGTGEPALDKKPGCSDG